MISPLASPRTPSVPKRRGMGCRSGLPLRELRRLASLLETRLLALDDAGVTSQEAGLLERRAVVLTVDLVQGASDRETQRARLTGGAAAGDLDDHVVAAEQVEHLERVVDELLVQLVGEVLLERAAVHEERAGAGGEPRPGDGLLAAADGRAGNAQNRTRRLGGLFDGRLGREALHELLGEGFFDACHLFLCPKSLCSRRWRRATARPGPGCRSSAAERRAGARRPRRPSAS